MAAGTVIARHREGTPERPLGASIDRVPPVLNGRDPATAWRQRVVWLAAVGVSIGLLGGLHVFAPEGQVFYPRCGFYTFTGWHCPGCGGLRAMHHLTHGRILAAAGSNLLLVVGLVVVAARLVVQAVRGRRLGVRWAEVPPWWLKVAVAAVILFGVLRNLAWAAFSWLAP